MTRLAFSTDKTREKLLFLYSYLLRKHGKIYLYKSSSLTCHHTILIRFRKPLKSQFQLSISCKLPLIYQRYRLVCKASISWQLTRVLSRVATDAFSAGATHTVSRDDSRPVERENSCGSSRVQSPRWGITFCDLAFFSRK